MLSPLVEPPPVSTVERTFTELVWAGAAGNVAWALATLVIESPALNINGPWAGQDREFWARVAVLGLLLYYLYSEWTLLIEPARRINRRVWYWVGDGLLVFAVVLLAIASASPHSTQLQLVGFASLAFAVAGCWHVGNGWPEPRRRMWVTKGVVNFGGLAILWTLHRLVRPSTSWHAAAALLIVLVIWIVFDLDERRARASGSPPRLQPRWAGLKQRPTKVVDPLAGLRNQK
jgi:hypothetical protein